MNANYFLTFTLRTTVTNTRHDNEDKLNTQYMTVQKKKSYKKSHLIKMYVTNYDTMQPYIRHSERSKICDKLSKQIQIIRKH
jgi:hypothetical protein